MTPEAKLRLEILQILEEYELDDMFRHPEDELGILEFISDPEVCIQICPVNEEGEMFRGVIVDIKGTYYKVDSLRAALEHFIDTFFNAPFEGDLPINQYEKLLNVQFYQFR